MDKSYKFINERILVLRLNIPTGSMTIVATYAPEEGRIEKLRIIVVTIKSLLLTQSTKMIK